MTRQVRREWFTPLNILSTIIVIALVLGIFIMFVRTFEQVNIEGTTLAIDLIWEEHVGWTIDYFYFDVPTILNPPWSLLVMMPMGAMTMQGAWGALAFFTVFILFLSVPRPTPRLRYILSVLIVVTSYATLRVVVDANPEIIVTAGTLLCIYGYRSKRPLVVSLGVLVVTYKPQSAILLVITLGLYMLFTWKPREWLLSVAGVLAVVIPTMIWKGGDWMAVVFSAPTRGSIMDSSLTASLTRLGMIPTPIVWVFIIAIVAVTAYVVYQTRFSLTREKGGMLIAAALLISPYAAGNSALSPYAVGVIPLFIKKPRYGIILIVLMNLPYLVIGRDALLFRYSAYYWTFYFFLTWVFLAWRVLDNSQNT